MKCPKCGNELLTGAIVCMKCGTKLVSESNENQEQNPHQNNQPSFHVPEENKNDKSGIVIIVLFLLGAGVLAYFLLFSGGGSLSGNNEEKKQKATNTETHNTELPDNRINNTKKMSNIRTDKAYIGAVINEINMGKLKFYNVNAIYFVPVGDSKKCGYLESGYSSPFSNVWNYAYVGVTYDGSGYNYYFISEDGMNVGVQLTSSNELSEDSIYSDYSKTAITRDIFSKLKEIYNITENKTYGNELDDELKNVLTPKNRTVSSYVFISAKGCKY